MPGLNIWQTSTLCFPPWYTGMKPFETQSLHWELEFLWNYFHHKGHSNWQILQALQLPKTVSHTTRQRKTILKHSINLDQIIKEMIPTELHPNNIQCRNKSRFSKRTWCTLPIGLPLPTLILFMTFVPYRAFLENYPFQACWSPFFSLSPFPLPTLLLPFFLLSLWPPFSCFITRYHLASLDPLLCIVFSLEDAPFQGLPYETLFRAFQSPFLSLFSLILPIPISHSPPPI